MFYIQTYMHMKILLVLPVYNEPGVRQFAKFKKNVVQAFVCCIVKNVMEFIIYWYNRSFSMKLSCTQMYIGRI